MSPSHHFFNPHCFSRRFVIVLVHRTATQRTFTVSRPTLTIFFHGVSTWSVDVHVTKRSNPQHLQPFKKVNTVAKVFLSRVCVCVYYHCCCVVCYLCAARECMYICVCVLVSINSDRLAQKVCHTL